MNLMLINTTATLISKDGAVYFNSSLTTNDVVELKKLVMKGSEGVNPDDLELQAIKIINPKAFEKKEEVKKLKVEFDSRSSVNSERNKTLKSNKSFSTHFSFDSHGGVFYKGAKDVIMPDSLVEHMLKIIKAAEDLQPYVRFWELCLANPDSNARDGLFKFVNKQKLIITPNGYIVCYRRSKVVDEQRTVSNRDAFVMREIVRLRAQKGNLSKYSFAIAEDGVFLTLDHRTKRFEDWKGKIEGTYKELEESFVSAKDKMILTDAYSKSMRYSIGDVVSKPRKLCDSNPNVECSNGLHIGSRQYVSGGSSFGSIGLLCLVNPAKVVSVPYSDAHKMRVCEFKIIATFNGFEDIAEFEDTGVQVMEHEYINHEIEEIKELLKNKTFVKEDYSSNGELYLKYVESIRDVKVNKSNLLISKRDLERLQTKIKK